MSKFITGKIITGNTISTDDTVNENELSYEKWELPNVVDGRSSSTPELPTAEEIEKIEEAAYQEGLKAGFDEGLKKAQHEITVRCENLDKILKFLNRPLDDLDEIVTEQLFHLSMAVTGQIIRRELHTEPGQIVAVVREAMASLPIAERKVNIYLHPEDVALVSEALSLNHDDESQPWQLIDDPLLSRGGCRLQAGQSYIDASVETRLNRIIASLLGGERNSDLNVYSDGEESSELPEVDVSENDSDKIMPDAVKPDTIMPETIMPELDDLIDSDDDE